MEFSANTNRDGRDTSGGKKIIDCFESTLCIFLKTSQLYLKCGSVESSDRLRVILEATEKLRLHEVTNPDSSQIHFEIELIFFKMRANLNNQAE